MAKILIGRTLDSSTDSVQTEELFQLVPFAFDYVGMTYTGNNLTTAVYKTGGAAGTVVATLTLAYTGQRLDSVTRT